MSKRLAALLLLALVGTACGVTLDEEVGARALSDGDVDCSEEGLGSDDSTRFVAAHVVVDGQLADLCFGEENPTVLDAWEELAIITPPDQLTDLALFGGFVGGDDDEEEVTLAFVNAVDEEGSAFQMSVNVDTFEEDPDEAAITMAHEFAHVFTSLESQIDRTVFFADECDTYYNGEGCFLPDSIMADWVDEFWGNGLIDEIDPNEEAFASVGEDRCDRNPSFFGAYAASNPEEDFAETFGAYVYQVEVDSPAQQAKLDWIDAEPGLAEFRDRAMAAGRGPLDNNFDTCG